MHYSVPLSPFLRVSVEAPREISTQVLVQLALAVAAGDLTTYTVIRWRTECLPLYGRTNYLADMADLGAEAIMRQTGIR